MSWKPKPDWTSTVPRLRQEPTCNNPEDAKELVDRFTAWISSSRQEDGSGTLSTSQPFVESVGPTTRLGRTSWSLQSSAIRKSVHATSSAVSEEDIERISFVLDSEPPHQNLYLYHGVLRYVDPNTGEQKQESVTINELLLRGCTVRNTAWIIGLVVFTGADSKIMLNGGDTPSKRSKIEKETNFNVIVNFVFLIVMCLISGIASGIFDSKSGTSAKAFEKGADPTSSYVVNALVTFT